MRTTTSSLASVRNPLDTEVTLKCSASSKLVTVPPTVTIPPNSTAAVALSFRPVLVGEQEAVLRLESAELGVYEWGLKLAGLPTNPEKALSFSVPLGGRETQVFRFKHWLEEKADFKVGGRAVGGTAGGDLLWLLLLAACT